MKIAEEVAKRVPALAQYGSDGKPTGVYYEQLSVLLPAQPGASTSRSAAKALPSSASSARSTGSSGR